MNTKETMSRIGDLVDVIYSHPEGACGGAFHIVLDDDNYSRRCVEFCVNYAKELKEKGETELFDTYKELGDLLLSMPEREMICVLLGVLNEGTTFEEYIKEMGYDWLYEKG